MHKILERVSGGRWSSAPKPVGQKLLGELRETITRPNEHTTLQHRMPEAGVTTEVRDTLWKQCGHQFGQLGVSWGRLDVGWDQLGAQLPSQPTPTRTQSGRCRTFAPYFEGAESNSDVHLPEYWGFWAPIRG